jgi:hypothetical protein
MNVMTRRAVIEEFKPIPVRRSVGFVGDLRFRLRLLVDLQLLTCQRFLAPRLAVLKGSLLDVGCGEMPFRALLPPGISPVAALTSPPPMRSA